MTGQTLARTEERGEEERPMTLVPMRAVISERERADLRVAYMGARQDVAELQRYAMDIRLQKTSDAVNKEALAMEKALKMIQGRPMPVLGESYAYVLTAVEKDISAARKAGEAGQFGSAIGILNHAGEMLNGYVTAVNIAMATLNGGVPLNTSVNGMESGQTIDAFIDGLGSAVMVLGTQNHALGENILHVAGNYAANVQLYNTNDARVSNERDAVFAFVIERGRQAKAGRVYTTEQEKMDKEAIAKFEANLQEIAKQVRGRNINFMADALGQVNLLLAQAMTEQSMKKLEELKADMQKVLDRLRKGQEIDAQLMRDVAGRYLLARGLPPPRSDEEAVADIATLAESLRGKRRETPDGSPEWFGAQALSALDRGDVQMAKLATSLGMLQVSAAEMKKNVMDYVPDYWAMHDAMANGRFVTPAMIGSFYNEVLIASLVLESGALAARYGAAKGSGSERVASAAKEATARLRADNADVNGAERIFKMALTYADLLKANKGKPWPGMEGMEKAIDDELKGRDGSAMFSNALTYQHVSAEAGRMLESVRWEGKEMASRLGMLTDALERAGELAKAGNGEAAGKLLLMCTMYVDSVGRLGERRNGKIMSVRDAELLGGMETWLRSATGGKAAAEGTFTESYAAVQSSYVEREAERLGRVAVKREIGREEINAALTAAVKKAVEGDSAGANIILQYVADYYGQAGEGREEGWRYSQFATDAGKKGRSEMLQAIRMATRAGTAEAWKAAARRFDQGTAMIASLQTYKEIQLDARAIGDIYNGRRPLASGLRPGQVPMGERREDGTYQTISTESVRRYEAENPKDATLKGDTLATIMDNLESAARKGDGKEYEKLRQVFWERFSLVASRVQRKEVIKKADEQLGQAWGSMHEASKLYRENGEMPRAMAVEKLQAEIGELRASLTGAYNNNAEPKLGDVASLLAEIQQEARIAAAYGQVRSEIKANEEFIKKLGGGPHAGIAEDMLRAANVELEATGKAVLKGDWKTAEARYAKAVTETVNAMGAYEATSAGETLSRAWQTTKWLFTGKEYGKPGFGYETYRDIRLSAFRGMIKGDQKQADVEREFTGARLIETSILAVPASQFSQLFTDYTAMQRWVKDLVKGGAVGRAGEIVLRMEKMVDDRRFWTNIGLGGVGVALSVIPTGVTQAMGAMIFAGMGWDQVLTEYREKGSASWTSWAMLAAVPLTVGMVSGAAKLATMAARAEEVGATAYAARLAGTARALEYGSLGIGLGFSGYMGYEGIQMISEGEKGKGAALLAMALFPWAFAGGVKLSRAGRTAEAGAQPRAAEIERMLETDAGEGARIAIAPSEAPSVMAARELRNPRELFTFLKRLAAEETPAREAMLDTLPKVARQRIEALLAKGPVRKAIEAGRLEPDELSMSMLRKAMDGFGLPPKPSGPSGGPGGRRWEVEATGLLERNGVSELLDGLLVPAEARAEDPAAMVKHAAAVRKLEAIRAESPETAAVIDDLMRNPTIRDYLETGDAPDLPLRMIMQAERRIASLLPPEAVAVEQKAAVGYYESVSAVGTMRPVEGESPGTIMSISRTGFRAEGTTTPRGPGGGTPSAPQPVVEAVKPPASTGGAGAPPAKPPGVVKRGLTRIKTSAEELFDLRTEAKNKVEVPSTEEVSDQVGAALKHIFKTVRDSEAAHSEVFEVSSRADSLAARARQLAGEEGVSPAEVSAAEAEAAAARADAAVLQRGLGNAPDRLAEIVKAIYREAIRPELKDSTRHWDVLRRIYSQENVAEVLGARAGADPELAKAITRIADSTRKAAAEKKMTQADYMGMRATEPFPSNDAMFTLETCGQDASRPQRKLDGVREAQKLLGIQFTPAENAVVVLRFEELQAVGPGRVVGEATQTTIRAKALIDALPTSNNPIVEAVKDGILERAAQGGKLESIMLEALRSREVAKEVKRTFGSATEDAFKKGMSEAKTLDEALNAMADDLKIPMKAMWDAAQTPDLMQELAAAGHLRKRTSQLLGEVDQTGSRLAEEADSIWSSIWARAKATGSLINEYEPFTNWGGRSFVKGVSDSIRGGRIRAGLRSSKYLIPQGAAWFAMAYWGAPAAVWVYETLSGAATVKQGIEMCKERYGIACSPENAGWVVRKGLSAQAGLRETIHETIFSDVRDGIIKAAGGTLKGDQLQNVDAALLNAEKKLNGQVGEKYSDTDEGRKKMEGRIKQALSDLKTDLTTQIGKSITGEQQANIEKKIAAAEEDLISEFQAAQKPGFVKRTWKKVRGAGSDDGAMLFAYIVNSFPTGNERRPEGLEELKSILERGTLYDIRRIDELLSDGRTMSDKLSDINGKLADRKTDNADDKKETETALNAILNPWGITLKDVDALLKNEGKGTLDITDMADLRRGNWIKRGLVLTYMNMAAETFLSDTGTISEKEMLDGKLTPENAKAASLLRWYPPVYWFLLDSVRTGNIPAVYMGDVMANLSPEAIESLKKQVTPTTKIEDLLRQRLKTAGLYIDVGAGAGIKYDSFLGMLDQNALMDPSMRTDVKAIFDTYRKDSKAMAAFSSFVLKPITVAEDGSIAGGETVYGKPADLAALIISAQGKKADPVEFARQQGRVGPAVLAELDPDLLKPGNEGLVSYAVQSTVLDVDQNATGGLIKWLVDNKEAIKGNAADILKSLKEEGMVPKLSPGQDPGKVEKFLDGKAGYYRDEKGWWNTSVPIPGGEKKSRMERGKEEMVVEELKLRPVRMPGYERTEKPEEEEAPEVELPKKGGLSEEEKAKAAEFWENENNAPLKALVDSAVDGYYTNKEANGTLIRNVYKDNKKAAKAAFREAIYVMITDPGKKAEVAKGGIGISDEGEVTVNDFTKVAKFVPTALFDFLRSEQMRVEREKGGKKPGQD